MNMTDLRSIKQADVVVIGAAGKTGRRLIDKFDGRGASERGVSRSSSQRLMPRY